MAMLTPIENFLFENKNTVHLLKSISFDALKKQVSLCIFESNGDPKGKWFVFDGVDNFKTEIIDESLIDEFPKDICGIDNYHKGNKVFFVLNCFNVEYSFQADGFPLINLKNTAYESH